MSRWPNKWQQNKTSFPPFEKHFQHSHYCFPPTINSLVLSLTRTAQTPTLGKIVRTMHHVQPHPIRTSLCMDKRHDFASTAAFRVNQMARRDRYAQKQMSLFDEE